jgi:hypothetical protein
MNEKCVIRFTRGDYNRIIQHLFPGDHDEHGAVILAGLSMSQGRVTLLVREIHVAREGIDYVEGTVGYRALSPSFIHRMITRARDQRLVYLAVHNHAADTSVNFSSIDFQSHRRGYPALLQIAKGMPVGALVFGRRSLQADLWMLDGSRQQLGHAIIVGSTIERLGPRPLKKKTVSADDYDRQVRMFGKAGQSRLADSKVAVIGLGGIGSLVTGYLARLGIGNFLLIDDDHVETSNLSRIVGATVTDAKAKRNKTEVAERLIRQANPSANIESIVADIANYSIAMQLAACDYLFLAADSMRARLVVNAVVHQYLIPGVQLGAKIRADENGRLLDVMSVNRPLRPALSCLWCSQLIDTNALAIEAKSDEERKQQAYGTAEPNPSVITVNAVSAADAVNDFMLDYLGLREESNEVLYEHHHHLARKFSRVLPRSDDNCTECARQHFRFARGDSADLPCISDENDESDRRIA